MTEAKKPFHELVADRLIEQLKQGTAPWQKPWVAGQPGAVLPYNPTTDKRYRGINAMFLMAQGHEDQRWMTYKQAAAVDAQVRKGEKGTPIQYWKFSEEQNKVDAQGRPVFDSRGEPVKENVKLERPRVFFATVFNAEQIDGLPPLQQRERDQTWTAAERAERILAASGAVIKHSMQDRAFYRPATDSIHLPDRSQFQAADAYYATALHELGHWTGHSSRLDRDLANPFGSEGYAKEELRAEIASMIIGDELGIGHDPGQHAAYVASWIKVLENDPMEIVRAAADAEKVQDYVLAFEQVQQQTQEATQTTQAQIEAVLSALEEAGWTRSDGAAIASKTFDTVNVTNDAAAFVTKGDGINRTLQFQYTSEGRNVTEADGALIPVGATAAQAYELATVAAARAEKSIRESYGVRIASLRQAEQGPQPAALSETDAAEVRQAVAAAEAYLNPFVSTEGHPGRLVDRLQERMIMSQPDAALAAAWRDLKHGGPHTLAIDTEALHEASQRAFGVDLPVDWTGYSVAIGPNQTAPLEDIDPAAPEITVFAQVNGPAVWVPIAKGQTLDQAQGLVERLGLIDAHAEANKDLQALKLARVRETSVHANPNAGEAARIAATDARTQAEDHWQQVDPARAELEARYAAEEQAMSTVHVETSDDGEGLTVTSAALHAESAAQKTALEAGSPAAAEKTYLAVPFKQKDEAKALGARWDRQQQSWFVPAGVDPTPFAKWTAPAAAAPAPSDAQRADGRRTPAEVDTARENAAERLAADRKERVYLAVPYEERAQAKAAGAEWDKVVKSWYVGASADASKLQQWVPRPDKATQDPAMTPREEFANALRDLGCQVEGEHPIMDGKRHRIAIDGDKKGERSGFYVGHEDGHPAGYIKNNRTGDEVRWKSKGYSLDPAQRAQLAAESAVKLAQRAEEQARTHEQTANRIVGQINNLRPVEQRTPYMESKGIGPQPGAFTDREGKTTYIPAIDTENRVWTMQYIQEDGTKRFAKDSRKEGCFHAIGGLQALAAAPAIVIAEGYATAATLAESLGFATVAAFDAGNLPAVATALQAKFPEKAFVIAGDDDLPQELKDGRNPGRAKAEEAAKAVNGTTLLPIFAPGERQANPKAFTDFNDLANNSVLGREAVERQARSVVDAAIERKAQGLQTTQEDQRLVQSKQKSPPLAGGDAPEARKRRVAKM